VALMFAALSTRLWYLQVLAAPRYRNDIVQNSVRLVQTDAQRGRILDDTGKNLLVGNRMSLEVQVSQQQLGADPEAEILKLSQVIKVPAAKISAALQDKRYYAYQPIPVAIDVPESVALYIGEHDLDFPGVQVVPVSLRDYPDGTLAAHILGSTGPITADQLKEKQFANYDQSEIVGQSGLESVYESFLQGTPGLTKYLVNASGQIQRQLGSRPAVPGNDLVLSIDQKIQQEVEDSLSFGIRKARGITDTTTGKLLQANAGAVVVMNVADGSVKALASYPTFNPNWFVKGLTKPESVYIHNSFQAPLYDRAVQAAYAPGSTFKPFIALAALQAGIANIGGTYDCPAQYFYPTDPNHAFNNWDPTNQGFMSIATALKVSCDTVFYQFGGKFYQQYLQNPFGKNSEPLQRNLRDFGFGRDPGVDLPSQNAGLIPTAEWKKQFAAANPSLIAPDERSWLPGDDIEMSIGQGFVNVSPLQLATAYSAIANGGHLCEPRIADRVQTADGTLVKKIPHDCRRKLPYTQAQLDYVRNALGTVTQPGGTAGYAFAGFPLSQLPVAGKTGTAERPGFGAGQTTSWFAAMVPANAPKYVIVCMVEQGGHGSTTAAPIVRQIIERMYGVTSSGFVGGGSAD
jgi:penicillin-binding protein 2